MAKGRIVYYRPQYPIIANYTKILKNQVKLLFGFNTQPGYESQTEQVEYRKLMER
jgi:hypothetical protein